MLVMLASLGILLSLNWLPFFSQPQIARADAFVIGSEPEDGLTIAAAPAVVRIFFNADISPASSARVFVFVPGGSPNGREVGSGSAIPAANQRELDTSLVSPATLPQGSYEVRWTAVANGDGQVTHGLIGFNVGVSATGLPGNTIIGPSTSNILPQMNLQGILATIWEWITLLALTFWIGLVMMEAIFIFGVMPATHGTADNAIRLLRKQGFPLQWLCLYALLAAEIINLVLRSTFLSQLQDGPGINPASIRAILLQSSYGHLWLIRIGLICCALAFAWWTSRPVGLTKKGRVLRTIRGQIKGEAGYRFSTAPSTPAPGRYRQLRLQIDEALQPPEEDDTRMKAGDQSLGSNLLIPLSRRHTVTWLLLAALILLTFAFSDNTAQLAQAHSTAIVLSGLRLLAQAAWLGGTAYLGFVLLPLLPTIEPEGNGSLLVNVLRYYVPLLLTALGILLLSSLFGIETTISSPDQLLNDPYGRTVLVELLFFTLMLIFTMYSFFILLPALRRQVVLLPVVNADLPVRRARRSALGQSISSLKRAMHILSALGAGILLCAALMTFYAPPIVFPPLPAQSSDSSTGSAHSIRTQAAGNLVISLEVLPAQVNTTNVVVVTLKDSSGNPVTNASVRFSTNMELMDMGTAIKDVRGQSGNATYVATFSPDEAFSMAGTWVIILAIQQPGHAPVQAQFLMTLTE
jgi:methionine-rich copper-binding protein CopC/putative copper export protein